MEHRGPKLGDALSLWNFTPSPGWTVEESETLRLLLMDIGIGRWVQILSTGLLPGKLIQQLYGATQRLLGQQSLAAFTGLRLDVDRIRIENEARRDAPRKSGLIIHTGPPLTRGERDQLRAEAESRYGLTEEQAELIRAKVQELLDSRKLELPSWQAHKLLTSTTEESPREELLCLLTDLHAGLGRLKGQLAAAMARRRRMTKVARPPSVEGSEGGVNETKPRKPPSARPAPSKRSKPRKKRLLDDTDSEDEDLNWRPSSGASSRDGDPRPTRRGSGLSRRGSFAVGPDDDEDTSVLTAMGFSESQIRDALIATDGCLQSAIELLLA